MNALVEQTPDHSTISRTWRLYALETHKAVFRWVLKVLTAEGLIEGKTVAIDAAMLEAKRHCARWCVGTTGRSTTSI